MDIFTVLSIEEIESDELYSSRVQVTTRIIGVFTSEEAAQEAAMCHAFGHVHIIHGILDVVQQTAPVTRAYGHTE